MFSLSQDVRNSGFPPTYEALDERMPILSGVHGRLALEKLKDCQDARRKKKKGGGSSNPEAQWQVSDIAVISRRSAHAPGVLVPRSYLFTHVYRR